VLPRALSWFRGGAIVTFLTGVLIIGNASANRRSRAAWSTPWPITILTGALFGTLMFFNVVLVIWPKQQVVIASAKRPRRAPGECGCAGGGAAGVPGVSYDVVFQFPCCSSWARRRTTPPRGGNHAAYWASVLVVAALLEINSLTATSGATTKPIEKIPA